MTNLFVPTNNGRKLKPSDCAPIDHIDFLLKAVIKPQANNECTNAYVRLAGVLLPTKLQVHDIVLDHCSGRPEYLNSPCSKLMRRCKNVRILLFTLLTAGNHNSSSLPLAQLDHVSPTQWESLARCSRGYPTQG